MSRDDALAIAHSAHKSEGEAVILTTDKASAIDLRDRLALTGLATLCRAPAYFSNDAGVRVSLCGVGLCGLCC